MRHAEQLKDPWRTFNTASPLREATTRSSPGRWPEMARHWSKLRTCDQRGSSAPRPSTAKIGITGSVGVDVANVGQRAGDEVVQVYIRDKVSSVARPLMKLSRPAAKIDCLRHRKEKV